MLYPSPSRRAWAVRKRERGGGRPKVGCIDPAPCPFQRSFAESRWGVRSEVEAHRPARLGDAQPRGSRASCRTPRVCTIVKVLPWGLRRLELLVDGSSGPNARSGVHAERISARARGHGGSSAPTSDQARQVPCWTAGFSQEGKFEMRKAFEIGGLAAGLVLVV